jgi:hypothetical protein
MLTHVDEIKGGFVLGINVDIHVGNRLIEHSNQGHSQHPQLEGEESDVFALRESQPRGS